MKVDPNDLALILPRVQEQLTLTPEERSAVMRLQQALADQHPLWRDEPRPLTDAERERWLTARQQRLEHAVTCANCGYQTYEDGRHVGTGRLACTPEPSRPLTDQERIEARHWLQQLSEQARDARDAVVTLRNLVTAGNWELQWESLKKDLDAFTERVKTGKRAVGSASRDRNADGY